MEVDEVVSLGKVEIDLRCRRLYLLRLKHLLNQDLDPQKRHQQKGGYWWTLYNEEVQRLDQRIKSLGEKYEIARRKWEAAYRALPDPQFHEVMDRLKSHEVVETSES